jgi:hypothetical protein
MSIRDPVMTPVLTAHIAGTTTRRPFQFTVRTFFAAASLISLLFAAIQNLEGWPRANAVLLLVWLAVAGVYFLLQAPRPLLGLCLAPVTLTALWCMLLGVVLVDLAHQRQVFFARSLMACAFGWGVVLSIAVGFASSVCWKRSGLLPGKPGSKWPASVRPPILARRMTVVRMGVTPLLVVLVIALPSHLLWLVVFVLCILDAPFAPLYLVWLPSSDSSIASLHMVALVCVPLVSGGALYYGLGRIIDRVCPDQLVESPRITAASLPR